MSQILRILRENSTVDNPGGDVLLLLLLLLLLLQGLFLHAYLKHLEGCLEGQGALAAAGHAHAHSAAALVHAREVNARDKAAPGPDQNVTRAHHLKARHGHTPAHATVEQPSQEQAP